MVIFLDTQAYDMMDCDDIMEQVKVIVHRLKHLLLSNECDIAQIPSELEALYEHTKTFPPW